MSPSFACARLAIEAVKTNRTSLAYRIAIFHMNAAIRHANKEGVPSQMRAPLFRMLNWLRADLRRIW